MENMNKRDRQYKDAALGVLIGFIGLGLTSIILGALAYLKSCGII